MVMGTYLAVCVVKMPYLPEHGPVKVNCCYSVL